MTVDVLEGLNAEQTEAVTTTEGFVRVIAGAGSGKTRALTHRFAYLVNDLGILPANILCVTFTNKAAAEMRTRIRALTGDNDTGYISTFHGFCVSVLQEDIHVVQYPKEFLVLDNADIDTMLAAVYEERGLTLKDMTFSKARDMIEVEKLLNRPDYCRDLIAMSVKDLEARYREATTPKDIIFYGYLYKEKQCFGLDYNDLIKFSLFIFKENEAVRQKWQERIAYVMVDEFQDIDALQYELMTVLTGYHKNLFVVGDPDQTIYTWRGARVEFLLNFDREFPGTKTVLMTKNYRSTPEIVGAVNSLIAKNRERIRKDLVSQLPSGPKVTVFHAETAVEEAQFAADTVLAGVKAGKHFGDYAVLYRAHYVTQPLEAAFIKAEIPYVMTSGAPFFARKEVKDALSYVRMAVAGDDLSFERIVNVPKRNLGERRMAFLKDEAARTGATLYRTLKATLDNPIFKGTKAKAFVDLIEEFAVRQAQMTVTELLTEMLEASGYEVWLRTQGSQERLDNLAQLKQAVSEWERTCGEEARPEHFLARAALLTNDDAAGAPDKVRFMTIHAAKGLEFKNVFLVSMNEGVLPSKKTRTLEGMEEERRLAFVAMTRAEETLTLTESEGYGYDGIFRYPSRFVLDIAPALLTFVKPLPEMLVEEARRDIHQRDRRLVRAADLTTLLEKGTRVEHKVFGRGTVLGMNKDETAYLVQFEDVPTPRAIAVRVKLKVLDPYVDPATLVVGTCQDGGRH